MSEYVFMPFALVDGVPTFRDSEILHLYGLMVRDKTVDRAFYDGSVSSPYDFLSLVINRQRCQLFVVYRKVHRKVPVGMAWLTNFEARWARVHFCVFREGWGKDIFEIGWFGIREIFNLNEPGTSGRPRFHGLTGLTPTENTRAIRFIEKLGFQRGGILPFGWYDQQEQVSKPALLTYLKNERG